MTDTVRPCSPPCLYCCVPLDCSEEKTWTCPRCVTLVTRVMLYSPVSAIFGTVAGLRILPSSAHTAAAGRQSPRKWELGWERCHISCEVEGLQFLR
jgi:hypothetical protein